MALSFEYTKSDLFDSETFRFDSNFSYHFKIVPHIIFFREESYTFVSFRLSCLFVFLFYLLYFFCTDQFLIFVVYRSHVTSETYCEIPGALLCLLSPHFFVCLMLVEWRLNKCKQFIFSVYLVEWHRFTKWHRIINVFDLLKKKRIFALVYLNCSQLCLLNNGSIILLFFFHGFGKRLSLYDSK